MKSLLIQLRDALATADRVNVDREGVDGPDGHDENGKAADHILTPEFRQEWREIREALAAAEKELNDIEANERLDDLDQYRESKTQCDHADMRALGFAMSLSANGEPDDARNLGLLNPMSAPRRVGL